MKLFTIWYAYPHRDFEIPYMYILQVLMALPDKKQTKVMRKIRKLYPGLMDHVLRANADDPDTGDEDEDDEDEEESYEDSFIDDAEYDDDDDPEECDDETANNDHEGESDDENS